MAYILGIESSCDDVAAAVFDTDYNKVISSCLFSQIDLHAQYGGVVPEIASREHMKQIRPIIEQALQEAAISLQDLDAIAVTNKPGLAGSLLIGLSFGKTLAWSLGIPLIAIDHLEGHIFSSFLEVDGNVRKIPFPHACFSASGGHTSLHIVHGFGEYERIGSTSDDAAGEAFDKISKLIGLGYPGGPIIEQLATQEHFVDYFSYPRLKHKPDKYDFSFSGLKTAVMYDAVKRGFLDSEKYKPTPLLTPTVQRHIASSLLVCIGDIFVNMVKRVFKAYPELTGLTFVGGVACNKYLRSRLEVCMKNRNKFFIATPPKFCTDNAGMISLVGSFKFDNQEFSALTTDIFE